MYIDDCAYYLDSILHLLLPSTVYSSAQHTSTYMYSVSTIVMDDMMYYMLMHVLCVVATDVCTRLLR